MLTLIVKAVKKLAKGLEIIAHSLALTIKRNAKLKAANKAATQHKFIKESVCRRREPL